MDAVIVGRIASWLRKAQLQKANKPVGDWNTGEIVTLRDPVFDGSGNLLQEPDRDYRISLVRPIQYGDSRGIVHWKTPRRGEPRQLDISIPPMSLRAVKLVPLDGGPAIAVLTELPGENGWRDACRQFRVALAGAKHDFESYEQGLRWSGELQRQVVRLRSATAMPAESVRGHSAAAIALHADMLNNFGDQACDLVKQAVAAAHSELLLYHEPIKEAL
jgi:hypothetical protein